MKGNIYFHPAFQFHDFGSAPKLLILLNEPVLEEPYIIAKTTSNLRERMYSKGCNDKLGVFYIEANADGNFSKPTLITVNDVYEISNNEFTKDIQLQLVACLADLTMSQIINCIRKYRDDISVKHFDLVTKKAG